MSQQRQSTLTFFLFFFDNHEITGAKNRFAKFLLCCLKWCSCCMDQFIQFLNRNAYIMVRMRFHFFISLALPFGSNRGVFMHISIGFIDAMRLLDPQVAIHGQNFCTSARDAFLLLMRNIVRWDYLKVGARSYCHLIVFTFFVVYEWFCLLL